MSAGNDNLTPDGPNHAAALSLLNDLMLVLDSAAKQGVERYCSEGEPVYDFAYWSSECARVIGMRKRLAMISKRYRQISPDEGKL